MKNFPLTLEEIRKLTADFPTPFYLYDEKAIVENIHRLQKAFSWNSGFKEYFAVKALPNPHIMKLFRENGCGAECCSFTELLLANASGFSGEDIMFTSNVTSAEEFRLARKYNSIINLDDITHINYLKEHAKIPETICCRLTPSRIISLDEQTILNYEDQKFGFTVNQMIEGMLTLKEYGVKHFGIHTQFGCHKTDPHYFGRNAALFFQDIVSLYHKTGIRPDFINLAGGIGIAYQKDSPEPDIFRISQAIQAAYNEVIIPAGLDPLPLYLELGIFMTGPFGYFLSSVRHQKKTYRNYLGLDASTNAFMSPLRYNHYHEITVLGKESEEPVHSYDITGSLCENRDKFANHRQLPETVPGDILVFHDAGAYSFCQSTNFNGRLRPAELLLRRDGSVISIRRAETETDYFATLDFPIDNIQTY